METAGRAALYGLHPMRQTMPKGQHYIFQMSGTCAPKLVAFEHSLSCNGVASTQQGNPTDILRLPPQRHETGSYRASCKSQNPTVCISPSV